MLDVRLKAWNDAILRQHPLYLRTLVELLLMSLEDGIKITARELAQNLRYSYNNKQIIPDRQTISRVLSWLQSEQLISFTTDRKGYGIKLVDTTYNYKLDASNQTGNKMKNRVYNTRQDDKLESILHAKVEADKEQADIQADTESGVEMLDGQEHVDYPGAAQIVKLSEGAFRKLKPTEFIEHKKIGSKKKVWFLKPDVIKFAEDREAKKNRRVKKSV